MKNTQNVLDINKSDMLDTIKAYLNIRKNSEFANYLGISPQSISNWYRRNTFDAELIYTKCVFVNPEWLLTGKGEMLRSNSGTTNIHNVKKQKPPPVSTPEHEMATIYSMILERSENMARELGRLDAENKQLQTENKQLKAENEELKKYKLHPLRSDFDSVPSNPLIIVDKPASKEYELETQ